MIRKIALLSLFLVCACDNNKDDKILSSDVASSLINEKISSDCVYSNLSHGIKDIEFNTQRRYYDNYFNEMRTDEKRDTISIETNGIHNKALKQINVLANIGLFEKTNDKVISGGLNLNGYFTDPVNYKNENYTETTTNIPGLQFKITKKGEEYISVDKKRYNAILVCIGKMKVKDVTIYNDKEAITSGRFRVKFNADVVNTPSWLDTIDVKKSFPSISEDLDMNNGSHGEVYITRSNKGFSIENDGKIFLSKNNGSWK